MEYHYCWKCDDQVPFLNESEWDQLKPLFENPDIPTDKDYGPFNKYWVNTPAIDRYFQMTGHTLDHISSVRHHRLNQWGKPCVVCQQLLRTPVAKWCTNCGKSKEDAV